MIKCPVCGQRISSMAMTCPHCGVAIKGHLRECPECGEWMLDSQKECPECGAAVGDVSRSNIAARGSVDNAAGGAGPEVNPSEEQERAPKPTHHLAWVIVILILLIGGGGGWAFIQYQQKRIEDEEYEKEMAERKAQQEAENAEVLRIAQQDSLDWQKALAENSTVAIERYISEHPEGIFIDQASELRNRLARAEVTENDKSVIRTMIESELTRKAADRKASLDKDVLGVHYSLGSSMKVDKIEASGGAIQYNVECQCTETLTRSDPTKEGSRTFMLHALLDADKKVVEINI